MKKRVLSLFMVLVLCLTLLPTAAFAEGEDVSISGGVIGGGETGGEGGGVLVPPGGSTGEGGGIYVPPGGPTEGGGGTYIPGEDTRTEIWCVSKPDSIGRSYDGTTDGGRIPINLTFTDGTNEIEFKEGTDFSAVKTFDSADAGWHTVTVEITLIGEAAAKYKLKAGEEKFEIGGNINKAYPDLTVSLSRATCAVGEKLFPLLSVSGVKEDAAVTYYYTQYKTIAGDSEYEGSEAIPKIDENTVIDKLDEEGNNTYYVYAKTGKTKNYEEHRSATVALTVTEPAAASVTKADGTVSGTYTTLPAALNAAQNGDTVKLLENHETNWSDVEAGEYSTYAIVTKTLTLDLNGMTVDYLIVGEVVSDEEGGILDSYDGNLTVVDNIQGGSHGKIKDLEFVQGSLAIQGGQIGDSHGGGLTCNENSGSVTISGGTVLGLNVGEDAAVTVNSGSAHAGAWLNDGTLNITGGTFGNVRFRNNGGTIAISGGTFDTITNTNGSGSIPLMPLLADNYAFYQGDNAQNSTEKTLTNVTVRPHTHSFENGKCDCGVAAIVVDNNNSCYSTLQAALNAAANNATITSVTLGQNLTEDVTFNRPTAESLTLNMNGHKLEADAGVPLTVTGGTLRIEGAAEINQNTASNANPFPAISLTGGKLVIAGDLTAQGGYNSSNGRKPAIYATDGELDLQGNVSLNGGLTITGTAKLTNPLTQGTFYVDASETGNAIAITDSEVPGAEVYKKALELLAKDYAFYRANGNLADAGGFKLTTGTYTIKSHTCSYTHDEAHGIAYCNCGRSHAHRDLSEEKSVLVNGVCPICGYHCPHKNIGDDGVCTDCKAKMVAKVTVGETATYTADLADALNKAANGTTITLLADTEISVYVNIYGETATGADQMVVTLDLAGHTVTSNYKPIVIGADRNITASYYGTLKIVGTGNITLNYATLNAREKGVLDLTDWTGGSISSVTVTRNGDTNEEGKLIVGKDAGHIGSLAFYNWPSAEITNTKLYGGSYGEITTTGSDTLSLAGLLPNGCAFKNADGSFANATESKLYNVTVSACDHGGAEGFDNNSTTCPYCNAPAVAETALNNGEGNRQQRRFANLQTAIDADRDGGAEFKLLTDVTGDYTINGTQDTALDLYGHSIKGTVTVKGIKGDYITTTLSNTENTTTASIDKVVACDGAELAGSKYPAVIGELTLAEGATWKTILNGTALGYKVLNADGTHKWYAQDDVKVSQLNNVIINRLPITTKTLNLKVDGKNLTGRSPKVERGTTVQLCASCNTNGANVYIYTGEIVGNNVPTYIQKKAEYQKIGTTWYYVVDLDANTIGTYDIYFTATKDGYSVTSSHKKLTVTKPNLSNAEITFPDGNEAAFNYVIATGVPTFVVTYKGQKLEKDKDYTISSGGSTYDVGPCTLTIKATDNGDYTGSKSAEWTVRPLKVAASVGDIIKTYDGTTDLPANAKITFKSADSYYTGATLRLAKGTDYEVLNAHYDSADASQEEKTISFTIQLKNEGYVFEDGKTQKDFTLNGAELEDKAFKINQATVTSPGEITQLVFNDLAKTYTIDLAKLLPKLSEGCEYGDIQYQGCDYHFTDSTYLDSNNGMSVSKEGVLTLPTVSAHTSDVNTQIGTITVPVVTTNYQKFEFTIKVVISARIPLNASGVTVSASEITYGQTLNESKLTATGTMKHPGTGEEVKGTFAWKNGTVKPDASDSYEAEWTFTPAAGYEEYAPATGTVTVKVKPAKLTVSVKASRTYYTGEAQIASIIASGQSVDSTPVTFTYSDKVDGDYTSDGPTFTDAGTYTAYYKAEAANHEPAAGTFTVTIDPLPISLLSVSSISKTYDGSADVTLTADKLTFFSKAAKTSNIKLPDTALSFSNAQFTKQQADGSYLPSPEVGGGKALSFTMTLTSNNYVFEGKSEGTTEVSDVFATDDANRFTITKAAAPTMQPIELTVINGLAKTYLVNLPALPTLGDNCKYGSIKYDACNFDLIGEGGYANSTAMITSNDEFQLTVPAVESQTEGSVGTVGVKITTDNYQDMLLTVEVIAKNKIVPVLDGEITATPITFGQILRVSTITGTMKDDGKTVEGTFEWTDPSTKPDKAGDYQAEWTFTPAEGYEEYATATGTVTIKVNKAAPTFTAPTANALTYTGSEQTLLAAGSTQDGTMMYRLGDSGEFVDSIPTGKNAGTYTVYFKVMGDENHSDAAEQPITVTIGPMKLLRFVLGIDSLTKTYDGTASASLDKDEITFRSNGATVLLPEAAYDITNARFTMRADGSYKDSPEAGDGKFLSFTVTLKSENYVFEGDEGGKTLDCNIVAEDAKSFTITKAAAPAAKAGELTITNGLHETYSLDLSTLLPKLTAPCNYGTITYDKKVVTDLGVGTFITLVDGKTGELTLEANRSGTDEGQFGTITVTISTGNYQDITLTINVIAKNRITPTGTPTLSKNAITYGDALNTIALSGKLHDDVNKVDVDGTFEWVDGTHIPVVGNGTYAAEWIFEPTDTEKYLTVSGRSNITVEKAQQYGKVSMAGYTYGQAPSTPTVTDRTGDANAQVTYRYSATGSGSVQTWDIQNPPALNAGTYHMYASISDTGNYYGFEAVYCEFVVAKATPTYTAPTGLTAKYGQTLADVTLPDGWSWMDSSESVGGASTAVKPFKAKFTPADTDNYNVVENIELEVTVNKADGCSLGEPTQTQKYTDASEHTYTPGWSKLPTGQKWSYSSEYSVNNGSKATLTKHDFAADGSLLTYAVSGGKADDKITITLKASCDNYEDFTITLNVTLTEKDDQKPLTIIGDASVVYGEKLTLTTTGGSGTGAVTYRIDTAHSTGEATIDPETGVLTPVKVGSVSVIADKAGDKDYNDVTSASFVLMIKPATPTGEPGYTKITADGKTLKDAALTTDGSTLKPNKGKLDWVDDKGNVLPGDTTVEANTTYKWRFTPDDDNYTTLTGEVELYHKSSDGGDGYSYYTIEATAGSGGSISPSGNVSVRKGRDQAFTITPDKGYAVSNVKIDGKSIGAVQTYTFENVDRAHTIAVSFVKLRTFVDVPAGSYYKEAVDWAVENGITKGTDDTHFSPDGICTRAQAVTFLWRTAGSPEPETHAMPFTDVPVGSYYYDAVLWAVENGITKGTSDTTFSPNMTCSRAQFVTFLWRSEKSPAAGTANPFADVKSTAYYADAVLWAVKENITKGTTNTTFSPDADCTRAQIVTFLWRCKK